MQKFVARFAVGILLFFGLTLSIGYLARARLLAAAGNFLVVEDPLQPAEAIVVLSGSIPDRILEAIDLYKDGFAPRLILTREGMMPGMQALLDKGGSIPQHHEMNMSIAAQLGVPDSAISLVTTPAWSTATEAQAIIEFLRQQQLHRILLVTSKAHCRRARMTYRPLASPDIEIITRPSRYDPFDPDHWWQRRPYIRRVVIEYLKLANYLLLDRWGGGTR